MTMKKPKPPAIPAPTRFDVAKISAAMRTHGLLDVSATVSGIDPEVAQKWYVKGIRTIQNGDLDSPYLAFVANVYEARRVFLDMMLSAVLNQVDKGNDTAKLWLTTWADFQSGIDLTARARTHLAGKAKPTRRTARKPAKARAKR